MIQLVYWAIEYIDLTIEILDNYGDFGFFWDFNVDGWLCFAIFWFHFLKDKDIVWWSLGR